MILATCTTFAWMAISGAPPRPPLPNHIDHDTTGDRCHYAGTDSTACERVLEALSHARSVQVDQLGAWPPPPDLEGGSPGFDVYLDPRERETAYVTADYVDVDPTDGRATARSYMVLDPRLTDDQIRVWVAHEFHHATQFATDAAESSLAMWEGAAVWAEEATWPGEGTADAFIPDFQATPWWPVLGDGYGLYRQFGLWSYFEYGAVLWFEHLHTVEGIDPIRLWQASVQEGTTNEPDMLDVLDASVEDWEQVWLRFAVARGARRDHPPVAGEVSTTVPFTPNPPPADLGMVYVRTLEGGVLSADGPDTRWGLASPTASSMDGRLTVDEGEVVAVIALGPETLDADDAYQPRPVTLTLAPPPDTDRPSETVDPTDPAEESKACACASSPPGVLWPLLGLVLMASRSRQFCSRISSGSASRV